jgi:hypothetical protein
VGLEIVTAPTGLCVSLTEFRAHTIEAISAADIDLTAVITDATDWVQGRVDRQFMPATWRQTWDRFPHQGNRHGRHDFHGPNYWFAAGAGHRWMPLTLDLRPVTAVVVTYYDTSGALQTLSGATDYWTDFDSRPPRIATQTGWPDTQSLRPGAVQVAISAGYADAAHVPNLAKRAIKLLAAFWFEQREAVVITESAEPTATYPAIGDIPFGVESICQQLEASGYT